MGMQKKRFFLEHPFGMFIGNALLIKRYLDVRSNSYFFKKTKVCLQTSTKHVFNTYSDPFENKILNDNIKAHPSFFFREIPSFF